MIQLSDFILLVRKILVGALITLIPFLIIWGSLRLIPKAPKIPASTAKSSVQSK
jgi:hypothetical protein